MKANELRIGNWLNGNHNGFSKNIQIYEFSQETIRHTDKYQNSLFIETFRPIPITEEWLLRFGFVIADPTISSIYKIEINGIQMMPTLCTTIYLIWRTNEWQIELGSKFNGMVSYRSAVIQFVHQLQNLYFALTGEELEIKTYENSSQNSPRYQVGIEDRKTPGEDQGDVPEREN